MIVEVAKGMPAGNVKKIVVKPSPLKNGVGHTTTVSGQQIIVLPSNLLQQISEAAAKTRRQQLSPQPAKIIVPASALKRDSISSSDLDSEDGQPARKRANLDHMTPEEKLMRRKLKNRVAAQNARDKKRVRMDEMEAKMRELEEINAKLLNENESLRALNERLSSAPQTTTVFEVPSPVTPCPVTPAPSDCYSTDSGDRASSPASSLTSSSSGYSLVDSRSFESAELINASQQKSQDRGWAGLWAAAMVATVGPAAFCLALASGPKSPTSQTSSSTSWQPLPCSRAVLSPLKKRQPYHPLTLLEGSRIPP